MTAHWGFLLALALPLGGSPVEDLAPLEPTLAEGYLAIFDDPAGWEVSGEAAE